MRIIEVITTKQVLLTTANHPGNLRYLPAGSAAKIHVGDVIPEKVPLAAESVSDGILYGQVPSAWLIMGAETARAEA